MTVKFQRNRGKTVVEDPYTRYLLLKEGQREGHNAEYYVPSLFFVKVGDNNGISWSLLLVF